MRNSFIASSALMAATAAAQGTGSAHVINACSYPVYMCNTPAQGGGYENIDKVLQPGDSYSQDWLQLSNGNGWSIKLAKQPEYQSNLMQYEYTFHNDGIIWYDLSEVDGNPWDGDWMITASSGCNPKQQAYRFSTDDAYGMQSCPADSEITVTLCSGEDSADGAVSSEVASATTAASQPAYSAPVQSTWGQSSTTTQASSTTTQAPVQPPPPSATSTPTTKTRTRGHGWDGHNWSFNNKGMAADVQASPVPTTMVTSQVSVANVGGYDVTVTDVATEIVTAYVTAAKRHEHHARHPHHKRQA